MIRITDQYFWNFVFGLFFFLLVVLGTIILDTETRIPFNELTIVDYALITLASWRVTQLFVYDTITKFIREQFYDIKKVGKSSSLVKPSTGPRRTLADLFSCPWCMGLWSAASVTFFYLLFPLFQYFAIFLSIAAVATFLLLLTNLVGNTAQKIKE